MLKAMCSLWRTLTDDTAHWQSINISPATALAGAPNVLDWIAQFCSVPTFTRKRWGQAGIPYFYASIKP